MTMVRSGRLVWQLTAALCISLIVIAGLVVAVVANANAGSALRRSDQASREARAALNCVNRSLALAAMPYVIDAAAHLAWARSADHALHSPLVGQAVAWKQFTDATHTYVTILTANQADRKAHPLGGC